MRSVTHRAGLFMIVSVAVLLGLGPAIAQQQSSEAVPDKRFTQGDEMVQIDFKDVELTVVIETIARITGRNFIYDDRVRGRVTIVSPSEVSVDQAFAVFESVLKIKGFTAVPGPGGVLKIVPVRDAKESSINTIKDDRPSPNRDIFVTRLVPLLYIDAEAITNTIKPLVSKDASMVAYAPTNTIILTDTEANIRRLLSILDAIDVETHKEELAVIKIKYADAATLGDQISEIYGAEVASTTTSTSNRSSRRSTRRSSTSSSNSTSNNAKPGAKSKVRIMTDDRTNSLLVLASRTALDDIRGLVKQLDVPLVGGGRIHVYYLKHADSEELTNTLSSMLSGRGGSGTSNSSAGRTGTTGNTVQNLRSQVTELAEGITMSADAATNSLVIQASKEAYEILRDVIQKLDIERPQVLVEALILEVDITDNIELGVQWTINAINGDQEFVFSTAQAAATSGAGEIMGFIQQGINRDSDGKATSGQSATDLDAVLKAAAINSNVNVVSSPHILTSDNEEAEIKIGFNIPIITSRVDSATGNTAGLASSVNVERQDIGVTLRVTPQISEGDTLRLKIYQQIEDIAKGIQEGVGNPDDVGVALSNRKVENTVVVNDNETVVIGGLISDQWTDTENKVPFLGDIPGLGWVFKSTESSLRKINLLIFLTPHIVRSDDDMEYETIRKREDFRLSIDETYNMDVDKSFAEEEDDPSDNPVSMHLEIHSEKYPVRRKQELEALHLERLEQQRAEREAKTKLGATGYMLRVKVFRNENKAAETLTQMIDAGYDGALISGDSEGSLIYELVIGPYMELSIARNTANALKETYQFSPTITVVELPRATGTGKSENETQEDLQW